MAQDDPGYKIREEEDGGLILLLSGPLDRRAHDTWYVELARLVKKKKPASLALDLSGVTALDDYGALVILGLRRAAGAERGCRFLDAPGPVAEVLELLQLSSLCEAPALAGKGREDPITAMGSRTLEAFSGAAEGVRFTGQLFFSLLYALLHPWRIRWGDVIFSMRRVGVDAVPIVGLISFLLGFIIAFMSSVQFSQFGANIFVATLVAVAMVRELGPIMTAIVVAGRSGSAFASEIGTMKVSEEIDALSVMGFDPVLFLTVPKLMAAVAVVPLLTLFANLFGVFGGMVVGVFFLDLTFGNYMRQTFDALTLSDILWTFFKGGFFAFLIAWISSLRGFQVRGGAVAVGEAATRAVVGGIFLIIFWDSIFAFIQLYYE
ncbi:MAG: MlaE family lipid ABC transporter permease subunit [Pseudomonadota bacterium]